MRPRKYSLKCNSEIWRKIKQMLSKRKSGWGISHFSILLLDFLLKIWREYTLLVLITTRNRKAGEESKIIPVLFTSRSLIYRKQNFILYSLNRQWAKVNLLLLFPFLPNYKKLPNTLLRYLSLFSWEVSATGIFQIISKDFRNAISPVHTGAKISC